MPSKAGSTLAGNSSSEAFKIEIGVQIGEHCTPGLQSGNPVQRLGQAKMAWMRRVTQGVDDPEVEPFEKGAALLGDAH